MPDAKKQLEEFINDLPVEEGTKKNLLDRLNSEGATPDLFVELKMALAEAQIKLNQQYQPQLDELKRLEGEEVQAYQRFEKEMDELENAADQVHKGVTDAMHQQELEDTRSAIASQ